jgi:subtilisin family serine protease
VSIFKSQAFIANMQRRISLHHREVLMSVFRSKRSPLALLIGYALLLAIVSSLFSTRPTQAMSPVAQPGSALEKLDSHLQEVIAADAQGQDAVAFGKARGLRVSGAKKVLVDVYITGPVGNMTGLLRQEGMDIAATNDRSPFRIAEGWLPIQAATRIAASPAIKAVMAVTGGGVDTGGTLSQGDAAHNGPAARALNGGVTGAGVVVGVISNSINQITQGTNVGVAASQATGDLPATVTVLNDDTSATATDEGRAMAEIIYDTAPGITTFLFDSGTASGPSGKAAAINNLVANGADIIADDIFYLSEPFFQDGQVAQAADNAVASGVAYFASAGNRARQSYESNYVDNSGLHDFDPSAAADTRQTIGTLPNNGTLQVVLQWAEPWGSATTDLNAVLFNGNTATVLAQDTTNNISTGLPIATLNWTNTTGGPVPVALEIRRAGGTGSPFMKYIVNTNMGPFSIAEYDTASDTINPDAASAQGSLAVAAVDQNDLGLNDPEGFSSRGLKTRLFDSAGNLLASPQVRQKPQIAGADDVSTSVPGFNPFFGTSAATPSVAGVAALVLSANPSLTVAQLYTVLTDPTNTIDCNLAGNPDTDCGFGFVLADRAVADVIDAAPPVITLATDASDTIAGSGWYNIASSGTDGVKVNVSANDVSSSTIVPPSGLTNITCIDKGSTTVLNTSASSGVFILQDGTHSIVCTATDAAGNTGAGSGSTTMPIIYRIDQTAPTLTPSVSPNPVLLNGSATANAGASDSGSGLAASSCGAVDTSSVGAQTVTCTATDTAGNTASASAAYQVIYSFSGFLQPIDNLPIVNIAKAGSIIPVRWRLTDANGVGIADLVNFRSVTVASLTCEAGATEDLLEEITVGASGLLYLGDGSWQYNWKTPTSYAKSCKTMKLNLDDTVGLSDAQLAELHRTAAFNFTR